MENNIYQAPKANLSTNETKKGSPVRAVLIAAAVDIVGTSVAGIAMGIVYGAILVANGMSPEEVEATLSDISLDSTLSLMGIALGSMISLYAGYLCAKIANHKEYKIVAILGIISVSFGLLLSLLAGAPDYSAIEDLSLGMLTFACVYAGAWLHVSRKQRSDTVN